MITSDEEYISAQTEFEIAFWGIWESLESSGYDDFLLTEDVLLKRGAEALVIGRKENISDIELRSRLEDILAEELAGMDSDVTLIRQTVISELGECADESMIHDSVNLTLQTFVNDYLINPSDYGTEDKEGKIRNMVRDAISIRKNMGKSLRAVHADFIRRILNEEYAGKECRNEESGSDNKDEDLILKKFFDSDGKVTEMRIFFSYSQSTPFNDMSMHVLIDGRYVSEFFYEVSYYRATWGNRWLQGILYDITEDFKDATGMEANVPDDFEDVGYGYLTDSFEDAGYGYLTDSHLYC